MSRLWTAARRWGEWTRPAKAPDSDTILRLGKEIADIGGAFNIVGPVLASVNNGFAFLESIPADTRRFGLLFWPTNSASIEYSPNTAVAQATSSGILAGAIGTQRYYDFRKHGALVCRPWYFRDMGVVGAVLAYISIKLQ